MCIQADLGIAIYLHMPKDLLFRYSLSNARQKCLNVSVNSKIPNQCVNLAVAFEPADFVGSIHSVSKLKSFIRLLILRSVGAFAIHIHYVLFLCYRSIPKHDTSSDILSTFQSFLLCGPNDPRPIVRFCNNGYNPGSSPILPGLKA